MNRDDGPSAVGHAVSDLAGRDPQGFVDVGDDGNRAHAEDRSRGRDERIGRMITSSPRADAASPSGDQGVRPARDEQRMLGADLPGELPLEQVALARVRSIDSGRAFSW